MSTRRRLAASLAVLATLAACGGGDDPVTTGSTTSSTTTTTTTTVPDGPIEGTPASIDSILEGQSANDVPSSTQRNVAILIVGCDRPHRYEAYATFRFPPGGDPASVGDPYPGETAVREASEQACFDRFEAWMGLGWSASTYDIAVWWPSEASWITSADRKVTCSASLIEGGLTIGSARGTAR